MAHEFLDALPIHAFQLQPPLLEGSSAAWRELLVTNLSSSSTPEFTLIPSEKETLASKSLPMSDLRYSKRQFEPGTRIEINTLAIQLVHTMTSLIVNGTREVPSPIHDSPIGIGSGSALIIDYGPLDGIPSRSLRGICEHKFTSPFDNPGKQDLTADVDFGCIKDTALSIPGARVSGPISQRDWLISMGLSLRADRMIKAVVSNGVNDAMAEKKRDSIRNDYRRLVGKEQGEMGQVYNVMSITPRSEASEGFASMSAP